MPAVHRLNNATLYIYGDDHVPPHVHLLGPNSDAMIAIETLQVLRGHFHRRDLAEAVAWMANNQERLRKLWSDLND